MRSLRTLVFGLLLGTLAQTAVLADTRVALVIGNGAYQNAPRLPNPANDAAGVAAALKRAGFDTILATDLTKSSMDEATIRFARAARTADVAMFYYSGHALQFAGVNYLAPIDIDLKDEADLRRMTRVDEVVADLAQAKNLRILVLDSCRDNPLADQLKRSIGASRAVSLQRGLAKIDSPEGMIVAYATQAGRTAEDGGGKNSPYTTAFLKHIDEKEEVGSIFRRISADVYETTKHGQLPELSLSLIGEFYLNGKVEVPTKPAPADPCAAAADHWKSAEAIGTKEAFEDHLARFPTCIFAGLAKARINTLNAKVVVATPRAEPMPAFAGAPPVPADPGRPGIVGGLLGSLLGTKSAPQSLPEEQKQTARLSKPTDPLRRDLITDCDRLAGNPLDTQRSTANVGVRLEKIDIAPARSACDDAVRQFPNVARFLYETGRVALAQKEYTEARQRFEQAVGMGSTAAMTDLGALYHSGFGVNEDYVQARQWYEKAAAAGEPNSMWRLGLLYQFGLGVSPNYAQSLRWYEKAAHAEDPFGMLLLGTLYEGGLGVSTDAVQARTWYEKAAEGGQPIGMVALGNLYRSGGDFIQARQWYEKAADAGVALGMTCLGQLYEYGFGVDQDVMKARAWYEKAAAAGVEDYMNSARRLTGKK
jgi:TPR repeat protein